MQDCMKAVFVAWAILKHSFHYHTFHIKQNNGNYVGIRAVTIWVYDMDAEYSSYVVVVRTFYDFVSTLQQIPALILQPAARTSWRRAKTKEFSLLFSHAEEETVKKSVKKPIKDLFRKQV